MLRVLKSAAAIIDTLEWKTIGGMQKRGETAPPTKLADGCRKAGRAFIFDKTAKCTLATMSYTNQ